MTKRWHNTAAWWKFTIERLGGKINRVEYPGPEFEALNAAVHTIPIKNLIVCGLRDDGWTVKTKEGHLEFVISARRKRNIKGVNTLVSGKSLLCKGR